MALFKSSVKMRFGLAPTERARRKWFLTSLTQKTRSRKARRIISPYKRKLSKLDMATLKEMREHPWATRATARRIAKDHMKKNNKRNKRKR